ncbi:hypothetical protein FDI40_gp583 [Agrobacterium phage Atu_ph07]|uniref:Uncharacterized protein n=1 Tax=Agrobacterium phage Atu_ph07 TaxID=2024264 RepID=A0A2L0V0J2_9CAUD|nr:hypothetical protein FDI40_gp583 [Agrobacterium phage Atu_ph07]AUZ95342.1 hypothetical protein [Agrobacterium phage Atu_ph07]
MDKSYDYYVMAVHKNDPYDSLPLCELTCRLEKEPDIITDNIHDILKSTGHSLSGYHLVIINKLTGIGVYDSGYIEHYNVDDIYAVFQYNKPPEGFYEYVIDSIPPKNNSPKILYEIDGVSVTEDEYNQRVRITHVKEMTLEEIEKELGYKIILKK